MGSIIRSQKVNKDKLKRAKELRREMTDAEKILWNFLRRNGLQGLHFRRQQIIDGYIVDFYCHSAMLVVEVDGEVHDYRVEEDQEREQVLINKGMKILRFKNEEIVSDVRDVLKRICEACGV